MRSYPTAPGAAVWTVDGARTVFQLSAVEHIEYRLGGGCDAFWKWQQVGDCRLVTRADL